MGIQPRRRPSNGCWHGKGMFSNYIFITAESHVESELFSCLEWYLLSHCMFPPLWFSKAHFCDTAKSAMLWYCRNPFNITQGTLLSPSAVFREDEESGSNRSNHKSKATTSSNRRSMPRTRERNRGLFWVNIQRPSSGRSQRQYGGFHWRFLPPG